MLELKTRVEELRMENEYQLRLKDMNHKEKIKELSEKFIHEMESLKAKNQVRWACSLKWLIRLISLFNLLKIYLKIFFFSIAL